MPLDADARERGLRRARSPEGVAAQVASRRQNAEARRQYVRELWEWGMSRYRIADEVGLSDATVAKTISGCQRPRYGLGYITSTD